MPADPALLLEASERPRVEGWSFRAALCRYAQPQPDRASAVMELLRRCEFALAKHAKALDAKEAGPLIEAMTELDRLGDALATWAVRREGDRPDALVDEVVSDVSARLEALGVPREERPRPTGAARRG